MKQARVALALNVLALWPHGAVDGNPAAVSKSVLVSQDTKKALNIIFACVPLKYIRDGTSLLMAPYPTRLLDPENPEKIRRKTRMTPWDSTTVCHDTHTKKVHLV